MTLLELEQLHRLLTACDNVVDQYIDDEEKSFLEYIELDEDLALEPSENILRIAAEEGEDSHIYLELLKIDVSVLALRKYLKSQLASNPLVKYSEYFQEHKVG